MNEYHIAQSFGSSISFFGEGGHKYAVCPKPENFVSFGGLKACTISNDRIVACSIIQGKNHAVARKKFDELIDTYLLKAVFITQGSLEIDCGKVIYKQGSDRSLLFLPHYNNVGPPFNSGDIKIVDALIKRGVPGEFFRYWMDASMTNSYSGKLLLMLFALEALIKNEEGNFFKDSSGDSYTKKEKMQKLLGECLEKKLFEGGGKGLRHRLAHGEYYKDEDTGGVSYEEIHKKVMQYFRDEVLKGVELGDMLSEKFVSPQRNSSQIVKQSWRFIESDDGKFDVVDVLQDLSKRSCGIKDCFDEGSKYFACDPLSDFNDILESY